MTGRSKTAIGGALRTCAVVSICLLTVACTQTAAPEPAPEPVTTAPAPAQPRVTAAGPKSAVADRSPEAIAQVQRIPGGL